jgi:transposase
MDLQEALQENERLRQENKILKEENETQKGLLFDLNVKMNRIMKEKANVTEKYQIERIKTFIPKTEVIQPTILNETEQILREKRVRKPKSPHFSTYDFERHVTDVVYEQSDLTDCPHCGEPLVVASEKVRYVVESIPATLKVTKIIKQSCKCPRCNGKDNTLYYPISHSLFPGSIVTPSFAAYVAYHKYELGIPFEHLSRHIHETLQIEISKQNLATYMAKTANILRPLYERMKSDLLHTSTKVIYADETTLSVSKRPLEDKERKKSYVYVYTSSYYDAQIAIYDFHESRSIDQTAKWLKDYEGVIVCDDYAGYTKLQKANPKISLQRCFAHVRRRFVDIVKALPEAKKQEGHAFKILTVIGKLFHSESLYREKKLLPGEIVKRRNADHPKILKELESLIFDHEYKPGSAIEQAVAYTKKVWPDLSTYLSSGYVEISNNIAERAVKPFVINRKVFMTAGSYDGARYSTLLFSIIRTARINDLNVSKYLEYVLDNIHRKEMDDLLPYSPSIIRTFQNA